MSEALRGWTSEALAAAAALSGMVPLSRASAEHLAPSAPTGAATHDDYGGLQAAAAGSACATGGAEEGSTQQMCMGHQASTAWGKRVLKGSALQQRARVIARSEPAC